MTDYGSPGQLREGLVVHVVHMTFLKGLRHGRASTRSTFTDHRNGTCNMLVVRLSRAVQSQSIPSNTLRALPRPYQKGSRGRQAPDEYFITVLYVFLPFEGL
jgi:hypothetical protein